MSRTLALFFSLVLLLNTTPALAQDATSTLPFQGPGPGALGGEPTGPLNCFDYYTFGSVQADLQPSLAQTVPGATLSFTGEIKSTNPYPLLDGTLYVKIFRRSDDTFSAGDGNEVVDQFVIRDNVMLRAQGSLPVSYEWKVPNNAEGGEYYAAYFFTTAKRYNLMGLSFTDDVVGNQAPFTITASSSPIAKLSKVDTTLNDRNHHFAAFPLKFAAGDTVTVKTTITNPTNQPKTLPLQWNQYAWDAMNPDNLRFTQTDIVTLAPGETKEVSYQAQPQRESVVYVTAVTQDIEAKSVLNIRYVREGIEETRINFPGLSAFPLKKETEATLFACAHSTNLPIVPGNTLILTLKNQDGTTIHEYRYEGDIAGAMSGFGETFTPTTNINYATLTATLERNGVIVEQVTQTYDCEVIDPTSCVPEETSFSTWFNFFTTHLMSMVITLLTLIVLGILYFLYRSRRDVPQEGIDMTTPMSVLFFLLMLPSLFFMPQGVEARTTEWNGSAPDLQGAKTDFGFCIANCTNWDMDRWVILDEKVVPIGSVPASTISVLYESYVRNNTTNQTFDDGTVAVGDTITFVPRAAQNTDIEWVGTGYWGDSPYGFWGGTGVSCSSEYYVSESSLPGASVDNYVAFRVTPSASPTVTKTGTASLNCDASGFVCTVTSPGTIYATITWPQASGRYYYAGSKSGTVNPLHQDWLDNGCNEVSFPLYESSRVSGTSVCKFNASSNDPGYCLLNQPPHVVSVSAQSISHNITAVSNNNAPAAPTVNGQGSGGGTSGVVNSAVTFNIQGSDPDSDTVRYGIDWDNNGTVDQWVPGTGHVPSGSVQSTTYPWGTAGTYTIRVLTQDSNSTNSGWTNHTVTITPAPLPQCTYDIVSNAINGKVRNTRVVSTSFGTGQAHTIDVWEEFTIRVTVGMVTQNLVTRCDAANPGFGTCMNTENFTVNGHSLSVDVLASFQPSGEMRGTGDVQNCNYQGVTTTANLSINGSSGPIDVPRNTNATLSWTSTNAASCTLFGQGLGSGVTVATSGSYPVTITTTDDFVLSCSGATDSVTVNVVNQTPAAPSVAYASGNLQPNNNITFNIQGSDPDGDNVFYEVDWDSDGTANVPTMTVPSNTVQPATYSWSTPGVKTFQARTVDSAGARSGWTSHQVTLDVPIPATPGSITATCPAPGTNLSVTWSAVSGATSYSYRVDNQSNPWQGTCSPTNPGDYCQDGYSGTSVSVGGIAGSNFNAWVHACNSSGCSAPVAVTTPVTCVQYPNLTQPNVTYTLSSTFNATTGLYDYVDVTFQTSNNGGSNTLANASYEFQFDRGRDGYDHTTTGSLGTLTVGQSVNRTERVSGNIPFGNARIRVFADNTNAVTETNEGDNERVLDLTIPPPNPNLNLVADRYQIRNGETVTLTWSTGIPYTMNCRVYGPGLDVNPSGPSGSRVTPAISAKSEYTYTCTEPSTNTTFTDTVTVQTQGEVEEI